MAASRPDLRRRAVTLLRPATAIDVAFARWELAHLHLFTLSDGTQVSPLDW
ncbi:hypothetical protein [Streptomyces wuyuanensis]|uniref:hypothetical protein n=1 Tax=Streptomyces wuyuanensis TaxID=1196353 RepID=UPI0034401878